MEPTEDIVLFIVLFYRDVDRGNANVQATPATVMREDQFQPTRFNTACGMCLVNVQWSISRPEGLTFDFRHDKCLLPGRKWKRVDGDGGPQRSK